MGKSLRLKREAAQANANHVGVPYVVFIDTAGNVRVERYDEKLTCHKENAEVFYPEGSDD